MVEKKVKKIDPEYYTSRAIEKKNSHLFSNARTRESKDVLVAKDCKQTIIKKQKRDFGFVQFDVTFQEY